MSIWLEAATSEKAATICGLIGSILPPIYSPASLRPNHLRYSTSRLRRPSFHRTGTANAIVWALQNEQFGDQGQPNGPTILHAYDATNLANELYNSSQNLSRDNPGPAVEFTVPVVINGKVYVGTQSQLSVFGELSLLAGVGVNPPLVVGGDASTGTVYLSTAAPAGGVAVTLSSSNPAIVTVPPSVFISDGATSITFPITTDAVTNATPVSIVATYGTTVQSAVLNVSPPFAVSSVSLNPTTVTGGVSNSSGTVTLNVPAPAGGLSVSLSSSNTAAATVPSNVNVSAGATSATFTVASQIVATQTSTVITATLNGSATATLTVNPVVGGSASFVRAAGASKDSAAYTVAISPAATDFLGVFVWSATTPTVTDNLGNTYTRDCTVSYLQGIGARQLTVYHLLNAPAGITGVNISSQPWSRAIVAEYSGMPTSGAVLDVCGTPNTQNAVTSWSSTATLTTANDLVFGLADTGATAAAAYHASGAWNGRLEQPDTVDVDDSYLEDQINVAAGSYTATGTTAASVYEASVVVAFKTVLAATITSANNATFTAGTAGSFTVTTTGSPVPSLTESGNLAGLTFTDNRNGTGTLSGSPGAGTAGSYPISFTASNGVGPNAIQNFTLTVNPAPMAPSITSANSATFTVGTQGSFTVIATGFPAPTLSELGALPSGVTFNAGTGVLSGMPASGTAGTYNITFTASNGVGANSMQNFTLTVMSESIWSNSYSNRRAITIDHTRVPNSDQLNFPMLFSGTYPYLATTSNGGSVTSANGYDIFFTSDANGTVPLAFEQESYSPSTGAVNYWVKIPTLSHTTDTVIYLFYGNSSVTTDQSNKSGVWDSNYLGMWHLEDQAANTAVSDSTSDANNGTAAGKHHAPNR